MKENSFGNISLIEGTFDPKDAKEILTSLITDKIQFHLMKNFSSVERYGKEDENSLKRIPELKKSIQVILDLISDAEKNNMQLKISSVIHIELNEVKQHA